MAKITVDKNRTTMLEITTSNNTVTVEKGNVFDSMSHGIVESGGPSGNEYRILGSVFANGGGNHALSFDGADTTVSVGEAGKLKSDYWGVRAYGDDSRIVNDGRIEADAIAIGVGGDNLRLVNRGTIVSDGAAIETDALSTFRMDNEGTIKTADGFSFRIADLTLNFGKDSVVEFGKYGSIDLTMSEAGWTSRIRNEGDIRHDGNGMIASVHGGDGRELVRNSGTMTGFVDLGAGDDRYDGRDGRLFKGTVLGGDGDDVYRISHSKDRVHESAGWGHDKLYVSASYTLEVNNEIEETRLTGKGDFKLTGNTLDNNLIGNRGDNVLRGMEGSDAFFGGAGNDVMTGGGSEMDAFYFKPNADREIVTDFTDGEDFLVLVTGKDIKSIDDLLDHHVHQDGKHLVISGDGTEMILKNFDIKDLGMADFTG
jgi:Ca2+-binding RTX toxin-like protein